MQGSRGGYQLTRAIDSIHLGDVIQVLEGPVHLVRCQEDPAQCGQFHACNLKEPIQHIHDQLRHFIFGISLGALRKPADRLAGVGGAI
jgi:DNA-binding IscR family transcriptional regulator